MIEIDPNEHIVKIVRKHWFILVGKLLLLIFLVAIPMSLIGLFGLFHLDKFVTFSGSAFSLSIFFVAAWLIIVWMIAWDIWTIYYLNVLIITDRRIFDILQRGYFKRESSSFRIDRVQNISIDTTGVIQTLLNFGTIRFETAGGADDFVAKYIAKPNEVKKFINKTHLSPQF